MRCDGSGGSTVDRYYAGLSSSCWAGLERIPGVHGEITVLRITGEIDLRCHAALRAAIAQGLHGSPGHLVVDLSAVTFCSARGFRQIADGAAAAGTAGVGYAVSGLSPHLEHLALLVWDDGAPPVFHTTTAAVSAISAEQPRLD